MLLFTDPVDAALLDNWQRDFPVMARPFAALAESLGTTEADVLDRLRRKQLTGQITRVGATVAPGTISASTLAAVAAPEDRIEAVAQIIGAERGVNHCYLRENDWNLWFVVTGPDRPHVEAALSRIARLSGLRVLDLPLVRPFSLDLGFPLHGEAGARPVPAPADMSVLREGDREIAQALTRGLPLTERPYADLGAQLGLDMDTVIARIRRMIEARIIARLGVIVRHRALGWRSNAMVVWDISHEAITQAGPLLAAQPGVTLCYERTPVEGVWPFRLYSMIHARSHAEAMAHLSAAAALACLRNVPHLALFSSRCFKQTGAMIADERASS